MSTKKEVDPTNVLQQTQKDKEHLENQTVNTQEITKIQQRNDQIQGNTEQGCLLDCFNNIRRPLKANFYRRVVCVVMMD